MNNCPGLYWAGNSICSKEILDKIERKVETEEVLLETRRMEFINEIEPELEVVEETIYKVPRRFKSYQPQESLKK